MYSCNFVLLYFVIHERMNEENFCKATKVHLKEAKSKNRMSISLFFVIKTNSFIFFSLIIFAGQETLFYTIIKTKDLVSLELNIYIDI